MAEKHTGNAIRLEGFLDVELINKKNHFRKKMHNTITKAGKQLLLDKSAALILNISAEPTGNMSALSNLTQQNQSTGRWAHTSQCLTNMLLNLSQEQLESLAVETTHLHLYDDDLINPDRIIGYANNNVVPTADGKEGRIDYCKGEYIADDMCVAKRWIYPEGVGTGTINAIAMAPAATAKTANSAGFSIWKCLDKANSQYTNFGNFSTGFCPPGVTGITDNNHILLNFKQDGKERWSYNLQTGEIEEVGASDPFWVIPQSYANTLTDFYFEDGYIYLATVDKTVLIFHVTSTGAEYVTSFSISTTTNYQSLTNPTLKFLKYNEDLYVTFFVPQDAISISDFYVARKVIKGSYAYYSRQSDPYTDYSFITNFTPPAGLAKGRYCLGNYGENYCLYAASLFWSGTPGTLSFGDISTYTGYVFASLSDMWGTLLQKVCAIPNKGAVAYAAGSNKGFVKLGNNMAAPNATDSTSLGVGDNRDHYTTILNNSTQKTNNGLGSTGVWFAPDGSWSDLFSFVKLTEPVEKTDDDILYVSYGYRIV